jgi:hypothetical protein
MLTEQEIAKAITIDVFGHEYTSWIRNIHFTWQGEEQFVELAHSDMDGYDIVESRLTEAFEEWLEENGIKLDKVLDDLTWQLVK